jgi:hypothetical protein
LDDAETKKTARPAKGAPFFYCSKQRRKFVVLRRMKHAPHISASSKKIPAFRRANDTLFNVSERSATYNRVSGNGTTLLLTITPAQL